MRRSTLGFLTGLIFLSGQSAAIAAADLRCQLREEREGQDAYVARVHNACDARWRSFQPPRATSGNAYDHYMRRCETACVIGGGGVPSSALALGGLAVAGGAAAAAAGSKGGGSSPASP